MDTIEYYYNDKGYKIKPMYYDWRRNKIITYTLIGPDDKYIATEKLLRDVQLLYARRFSR